MSRAHLFPDANPW